VSVHSLDEVLWTDVLTPLTRLTRLIASQIGGLEQTCHGTPVFHIPTTVAGTLTDGNANPFTISALTLGFFKIFKLSKCHFYTISGTYHLYSSLL
jgi:hypothetical protein